MKDPEHARNHGEIEKWLRTHNTRDGRRRGQTARNRLRERDGMRRKGQAVIPPRFNGYNPNGPN